jgi:hypothetical protein
MNTNAGPPYMGSMGALMLGLRYRLWEMTTGTVWSYLGLYLTLDGDELFGFRLLVDEMICLKNCCLSASI